MIYLDNSATTTLCDGAKARMNEAMDCFGNPSSLHSVGYDASVLLGKARQTVLSSLGVRKNGDYEIFFTGSGTEANNMALCGVATAKTRLPSRRIIISDSEHPSVEQPAAYLEQNGFEVVRIPTRSGVLDTGALRSALEGGALMISLMLVNNETGALYDVAGAFAMARSECPDIVTHCDATQGYLKVIGMSPARLGADLMTVSAHKIHGPKGVGVLCVSKNILRTRRIVPVIRGGGQESGLRSGTENMIGICGFMGAVETYRPRLDADIAHMTRLRDYTAGAVVSIPGVRLNLPSGARAPHIINLTLPDIKSETMVHFLSSQGIAVSGGSACSSHSQHVSAALLGFGLDAKAAMCSLRVSLCPENTETDIDAFVAALRAGVERLVRIR